MVCFTLVHLFRIDTLLPIMRMALPFSTGVDDLVVVTWMVVQVFAVPALLMMPLSPLARVVSAFFAALAPLGWLWTAIWNWGTNTPIGLLGEFVHVTSGLLTMTALVLWLALNCGALWALGYGSLAFRTPPRTPGSRAASRS